MFGLFKKTEKALKKTRESWFSKVTRLFDRGSLSDTLWEELEELLISADVGAETTHKLVTAVKARADREKFADAAQVRAALKEEMARLLAVPRREAPKTTPQIVIVVGVNGSGKTTSIAKLAHSYVSDEKRVVLAAGDTFRAAAIEQLELWGTRVGAEVIAHKAGGDPGAVVFDAVQAASSRKADILIVDTAGRLHTKFNLMEELKKIRRVVARAAPGATPEVLLVLDATTGQNGLAQAKHFSEAVEVSGVFLSKLDGTAKGGIVLAICDQLKLPILYIGTGEASDDITAFDARAFVDVLFGEESSEAKTPVLVPQK